MNERPILFSAEMVRAILEDKKTQTRRVMKPQPVKDDRGFWTWAGAGWNRDDVALVLPGHSMANGCPYGQIGDLLWVRERWGLIAPEDMTAEEWGNMNRPYLLHPESNEVDGIARVIYKVDGEHPGVIWKPAIFMPHWACRIHLEILDIRVQRLNAITLADIEAEGTPPIPDQMMYRNDGYQRFKDFKYLWNRINMPRGYSFEANPWVWVIEFKRTENFICSQGHDLRG